MRIATDFIQRCILPFTKYNKTKKNQLLLSKQSHVFTPTAKLQSVLLRWSSFLFAL